MSKKRKKANQKERGILSYILAGYVFLMVCIYPFYFENGFYSIGKAKNHFLLTVSVVFMILALMGICIDIDGCRKRRTKFLDGKKVSVTEKFLYSYMVIVTLSFLLSEFKEDALWGADGWYLGVLPLLLLSGFTVLLAHKWKKSNWLLQGCFIVSGIVFLLGICNRFSFYPIPMKLENPGFISTLGNINWFCGYMSVMAPLGIGFFVLSEDKDYDRPWKKWFLAFYAGITFITGFCQGSEGVFLWLGILFFILLLISLKKTDWITKWLLLVALWGLAGQTVRVLRILLPGKFNYSTAMLIDTNSTLFIALIALLLYAGLQPVVKKNKELPVIAQRILYITLIGIVFVSVLSWVTLSVYNTRTGIDFLEGKSLFVFNESWGNARGAIYKTTYEMLGEMSFIQILFGVGPDGFSAFAYSYPAIAEYLTGVFGESVLTNAHCEILTTLINIGILGMVAFYGMLGSFVCRCMKKGNKNKYYYIPALSVICYVGNNLISFAQILNIPFLFLIIGIGEYYLKKDADNSNQ